jgi:integrase
MKYNVKIIAERRKDKLTGLVVDKNVPLFADIRFAGERFFYFTGYRIDTEKFNSVTQEARRNSTGREGKNNVQYNVINNRLTMIKAELIDCFREPNTPTKQEIIRLLDGVCKKESSTVDAESVSGFFEMFDKYLRVSKLSIGRKRHIQTTINHWLKYESCRSIKITFENVTVDVLRDFESFLRTESIRAKGKNSPEMICPIAKNTTHTLMKITRTFWSFADNELAQKGIVLQNPFGKKGYKMPGEKYGTPIYITIEERNLLFEAILPNERLRRIRDIFVFQCLIGARVGDLCKLKKSNISNNVLSYIPRKTQEGEPITVTIPLHQMAVQILSRYDLPDGRLLPFIADQRYNDYLKELFKTIGLTREVTRRNPNTGESEQVSLCKIASSHMARRAFVGNLFGKVDSGIISSMSGHIAGSKAFARYYNIGEELQREAIDKL